LLQKAMRRHADSRKWLVAWSEAVGDAEWQSLDDVRLEYPTADGVKLRSLVVITVFNVRGNEYRLLTRINYESQTVVVLELLSHAEYDKTQWKGRH
jgi:mRNA interferase HigB